jgi:predicted naringenin-chalcone synthase
MILDIEVPDTIASIFLLLFIIFRKNNLKITDMDHLIFHPGGKIVQTVEALFSI